jgi:hypothetical protein
MDELRAVQIIREKFAQNGSRVEIPLLKGNKPFRAEISPNGVFVDNLGTQPFLPWVVFQEAVSLLIIRGGKAEKGDAMNAKLGDPNLGFDSVEGHVASVVYNKKKGDSVFRRITPIACILIWAGICKSLPHELVLSYDIQIKK